MCYKKLTIVHDQEKTFVILDGEEIGRKTVDIQLDVQPSGAYLTYTCRERVKLVPAEENTGVLQELELRNKENFELKEKIRELESMVNNHADP